MSIFKNEYPYTNFHEMNLDWILKKIMELDKSMNEFEAINKIKNGGIWDISKDYEPWTIVIYNNESYLSQTPVPAGVNIDNPAYWLKISEFSSAVAALEQRMDDVENDIDTISNNINTINNNINTINNDIDAVEANINSMAADIGQNTQDIAALDTRVDNIISELENENRKYLLIADSYGEGVTAGGGSIIGWTTRFKEYMGLADDECYISQRGGAGFVAAGNGKTFLNLLNDAVVPDNEAITDVIVVGGYNDCWGADSASSLLSAVNTFVSACKTRFPNADLYIGATGVSQNAAYTEKFANWVVPSYQSDVRARFLSGVEYTLKTSKGSYISTDNIHPTQNGYNTLAKAIIQSYLTGYVENRTNFGTVTLMNEGNAKDITYMCDNNLMTLMINAITLSFTNITWGSWTNLGTFDDTVCGPTASWTPSVMAGYVNISGTFYYANCALEISDGILYAKFMPLNSNGSGYPPSGTGTTVLTGTLILPTIYV